MKERLKGMTINERLYLSGLMDEFDKAVNSKNTEKISSILRKIDIEDPLPILKSLDLQD